METTQETPLTDLNHRFNTHFVKLGSVKNEYQLTNAQLLDNKKLLLAQFKGINEKVEEANEIISEIKKRIDNINSDLYNFERKVKCNDDEPFQIETVEYHAEAKKAVKDLLFLLPRLQEILSIID